MAARVTRSYIAGRGQNVFIRRLLWKTCDQNQRKRAPKRQGRPRSASASAIHSVRHFAARAFASRILERAKRETHRFRRNAGMQIGPAPSGLNAFYWEKH